MDGEIRQERCTKDGDPAALDAHLQEGDAGQHGAAAQAQNTQPGLMPAPGGVLNSLNLCFLNYKTLASINVRFFSSFFFFTFLL